MLDFRVKRHERYQILKIHTLSLRICTWSILCVFEKIYQDIEVMLCEILMRTMGFVISMVKRYRIWDSPKEEHFVFQNRDCSYGPIHHVKFSASSGH